MGTCITCGNAYDKSFDILKDGKQYTFDSFECAIQHLAPTCVHCSCRIIGHGLEANGNYFCCEHCAVQKGIGGLNDRVDNRPSAADDR